MKAMPTGKVAQADSVVTPASFILLLPDGVEMFSVWKGKGQADPCPALKHNESQVISLQLKGLTRRRLRLRGKTLVCF